MRTRERVALAHGYRCARCGRVWVSSRDQIDHIVPLEQGGSNDESNLQPLCTDPCHKLKTAEEQKARFEGY
ncbi:HNH endonuclease [Paraburkholderia sp. CNPSo 3157]|uniref:HNH endonuclease n=2 Tax=Paraburkholderia franconis TaxID=2654983 RepID=A0A7X1N9H7_9BURK|nr:HNH endonuclease [Paraburkholderia franconis]